MLPFGMRFRKTQKEMESFVLQNINAEIENCEKKEYRTLLLFLKKARDPKTGVTLSRDDLVINAALLLYLSSYFDNR